MIGIGSDHGGFLLKEKVKEHYKNLQFKDFGTNSEDMVDFPPIAINLAESVANGECESGILICRTGIGMSIAANKVKGIRCALCYNEKVSVSAKEHNNANIIAVGADQLSFEQVIKIIDAWMNSKFLEGRYQNRNNILEEYEKRI
jgi:ribose 5-phosphate isomerase B